MKRSSFPRWIRWLGFACALGAAVPGSGAPPAPAADPAETTVETVLQRWRQALGGTQRLGALSLIDTRQRFKIGTGGAPIEMRLVRNYLGQYRTEIVRPQAGVLIQAFDGNTTWMSNDRLGFGVASRGVPFTPVRPDEVWFANAVGSLFPQQTLLTDETVGGTKCSVLGMAHAGGFEEKWFFAQDSGQLVRVEHVGVKKTIIEYSDFRTTDGLTLPFVSQETEGDVTSVSQRIALSINPTIPVSFFSPSDSQLREAAFINSILSQHLASLGGWRAAVAIHSRVTHLVVDVVTSGVKSRITISQKTPNLIVVDNQTPGLGRSVEGYDGGTGWSNSEIEGFRVLEESEVRQLTSQADLLSDARLALRAPLRRYTGSRVIDGHPTHAVALANQNGRLGTYYFDQTTGRLLRVAAAKIGDAANSLVVTSDYSDFRTVDGVEMPFTVTTTNPAVQFTTTIESLQNNVTLDNAIFKPQRDD